MPAIAAGKRELVSYGIRDLFAVIGFGQDHFDWLADDFFGCIAGLSNEGLVGRKHRAVARNR